jgi:hypothetical protein
MRRIRKQNLTFMKTKMLLVAAVVGVAAVSARAGVNFSFSIGLPVVVTTTASPVVVAQPCPPPVVVAPPAPVVVVPACPGPDYVWVEGCWHAGGGHREWMAGGWQHRPEQVFYSRAHEVHHW